MLCAPTVEAAHRLRQTHPEAVVAGEEWGLPPASFELGNSPVEIATAPVRGRDVILLSQNGTPALTAARRSERLLAAALVNVSATARWILRHRPGGPVTVVCASATGEDRACADHLAALLSGRSPDSDATAARVTRAAHDHCRQWRRHHADAAVRRFRDDASVCGRVDCFEFAMAGRVSGESVCLEAASA